MHQSEPPKPTQKPKGFLMGLLTKPRSAADIAPPERRSKSPNSTPNGAVPNSSTDSSPEGIDRFSVTDDPADPPGQPAAGMDHVTDVGLPPFVPTDGLRGRTRSLFRDDAAPRPISRMSEEENPGSHLKPAHRAHESRSGDLTMPRKFMSLTSRNSSILSTSGLLHPRDPSPDNNNSRLSFSSSKKRHGKTRSLEPSTMAQLGEKERTFIKRFPELPNEPPLHEASSALSKRGLLIHGCLYLTPIHLCFYSPIRSTRVVIPLTEIVELKRVRTIGIISNAISVRTARKRFFLTSFSNRDNTFQLINQALALLPMQDGQPNPSSLAGSSEPTTESDSDSEEAPSRLPPVNPQPCAHFPLSSPLREAQDTFLTFGNQYGFSSLLVAWESCFSDMASSQWAGSTFFKGYLLQQQTSWAFSSDQCCLNRYLQFGDGDVEVREHQVVNLVSDSLLSVYSSIVLSKGDQTFPLESLFSVVLDSPGRVSVLLSISCVVNRYSPLFSDFLTPYYCRWFEFLRHRQSEAPQHPESSATDQEPSFPHEGVKICRNPSQVNVPSEPSSPNLHPLSSPSSSSSPVPNFIPHLPFQFWLVLLALILLSCVLVGRLLSLVAQSRSQQGEILEIFRQFNQIIIQQSQLNQCTQE